MDDIFIIPAEEDSEAYVALTRTKTGKLYKKHLLSAGEFYHPKFGTKPVKLDVDALNTIKKNFDAKVCDIVQVPLATENNQHSESPLDNLGEVVDVEVQNGKLYAYMDIRDARAIGKMGKTMLGASAMLAFDYTDTRDGLPKGPTLLHACVTNRPHLLDLEGYEEILAASSDVPGEAVMLSARPSQATTTLTRVAVEEQLPEETEMTLDELLAELKDEHDIDVSSLQARLAELETDNASLSAERDEAVQLSADLTGALEQTGVVSLSNGTALTPSDVIGAVSELAQGHLALSAQVKTLAAKDAEVEVGSLVESGKVYPTQKEWLVDMKLSNPTAYDSFIATLPESPAVPMKQETGVVTPEGDAQNKHIEEIARLSNVYLANHRKK